MGESLFSSEPISLRMDRRSPEAVRLREAICKKLWEFLGDYSDDVLADYIVVLVCNGKHQNQARDDLQAFLGEQSGTFVAWLWDYLSQEFISKATPNLSNLEVKATNNHSNSLDRDYKKSILADHDAQSVSLSKDKNGSSEQPSCHTTSNNFKPSQMMERLRPCSPNLDKRSLAVNTERLNVQEIALQKRSGSNNEEHQLRPSSSRDFSEARLPSTAMNDLSYQTARLRGNVWDRLGKPCVEDKIPIKEEQRGHLDLIDTGKLELLEEYQNPRLTGFSTVASAISNFNKQSYTIDRGDAETVKLSGDCRTSDKMVEASTLKRKGHMCELNSNNGSSSKENFIQDKGYSQHQRQSFLVKQNREQSVNKFARVADKLVASDAKIDLINPGPDCKATVVFKSQVTNNSVPLPLENLVPVSTTLPVNSKSQSIVDGGNANKKPVQEDVLAVKSRLRQIEMDMLKLRSNQVVLSTDGGKQKSSVLQNLSKEVMESRTVLVANVHFAATKESLVSHFGKCGTIVKVIMLTDAVTALPKGAAYIVFANKESVDRAISLSGTSLFSRILKVIRKAEVPPDFLVPSQPALKQLQPFYPQPYGKIPVQKPPTSSHLQWRRIPSSAGESSLTASSNGRGPSNSVG
ncbi:zinc finger CCCH domain-containing protein 14-like isoform X3 [Phalaenopsis equestris]|uniref:zinc finger CCCH domain-containing protein 14-like isoform X3 n=1 Tax=Phalaenopsis equestris TaxID=78828 RepID=UPI0009E33816|nr:zinc finger CCCH domain-containing protein 14-like isoform X3 [Phalaenopsis equestris]